MSLTRIALWLSSLLMKFSVFLSKAPYDRRFKREFSIKLTILAVMVAPYIIYQWDFSYWDWYRVGFFKSIIFIGVVGMVLAETNSIRLFILLLFVGTSMSMDLASILSTELYWQIKPFRYEGIVNFKNGYLTYEILSIFYKLTKNLFYRIVSWCDNYSEHEVTRGFERLVCDLRIWLADHIQFICNDHKASGIKAGSQRA